MRKGSYFSACSGLYCFLPSEGVMFRSLFERERSGERPISHGWNSYIQAPCMKHRSHFSFLNMWNDLIADFICSSSLSIVVWVYVGRPRWRSFTEPALFARIWTASHKWSGIWSKVWAYQVSLFLVRTCWRKKYEFNYALDWLVQNFACNCLPQHKLYSVAGMTQSIIVAFHEVNYSKYSMLSKGCVYIRIFFNCCGVVDRLSRRVFSRSPQRCRHVALSWSSQQSVCNDRNRDTIFIWISCMFLVTMCAVSIISIFYLQRYRQKRFCCA